MRSGGIRGGGSFRGGGGMRAGGGARAGRAPIGYRTPGSAAAMQHELPQWVTGGRRTMSAATAAFLGSGRWMRATVAPPTTVNRACCWWRNLLQLRTLGPATLASATGPGCVKSRADAMILQVNRQAEAMDVRLRGGD